MTWLVFQVARDVCVYNVAARNSSHFLMFFGLTLV